MTGSYFVQFIFLLTQSHRWFIVTVDDTLHQFTAFEVTRSRIYAIFVQMIGLVSTSTDTLHPFSVSLCVKIPELRLESICRGKLYLLILDISRHLQLCSVMIANHFFGCCLSFRNSDSSCRSPLYSQKVFMWE